MLLRLSCFASSDVASVESEPVSCRALILAGCNPFATITGKILRYVTAF